MIKNYTGKRRLFTGTLIIILSIITLVSCTSVKKVNKYAYQINTPPEYKGIEYKFRGSNNKAFKAIRKMVKEKSDEIGVEYTDTLLDNTILILMQLADTTEDIGREIRNALHNNLDFIEEDIINEPNNRLDTAIAEYLVNVKGPIYNYLNVISYDKAEKSAIKYFTERTRTKNDDNLKIKFIKFEIDANSDIAEYIFNIAYDHNDGTELKWYYVGIFAKTGELDGFGW